MNNDTGNVILGAVLAIVSGAASSWITNLWQKREERKNLKIMLSDDLTEVITIISNMNEVWDKTKELFPAYLYDLESCMPTCRDNRMQLTLLKDEELRNDILTFYRDFQGTIQSNAKKAGNLAETSESQSEQKEIAEKIAELGKRAQDLKIRLKK